MKKYNKQRFQKLAGLIIENQEIEYKGKKYYIESPEGKEKVFAYLDKELKQVAKIGDKTLMFNTKDIEDKLIKENDGLSIHKVYEVYVKSEFEGLERTYIFKDEKTFEEKGKFLRQDWDIEAEEYANVNLTDEEVETLNTKGYFIY